MWLDHAGPGRVEEKDSGIGCAKRVTPLFFKAKETPMKAKTARVRVPVSEARVSPAPAPAPVRAEPVVETVAAPAPAVAAETPPAPVEEPVDPVLHLDQWMFRIWLIGAGILVLLHLLDAFYRVLMRR